MTTKQITIWASVGVLALGVGMRMATPTIPDVATPTTSTNEPRRPNLSHSPPMIQVQISGAVVNPGIYKVKKGTRIAELITLAGGIQHSADDSTIIDVGKARDGQHIKVPNRRHPAKKPSKPQQIARQWDINRESATAIAAHYEISKRAATEIVRYRSQMGWIRHESELIQVPTIPSKDRSKLNALMESTRYDIVSGPLRD